MNETRSDDTGGTRRRNWKRIVFKPSGEALAGASGTGLDGATLDATARDIIDLRQNLGVDVVVVVGGGNFWRGRTGSLTGMDATQSDHIGMLGTVMNALALQDALERLGQDTRVQSAIEMPRIAEAYIRSNLGDQIILADLVTASETSASSLLRAFRIHRGITPMKYVKQMRLECAQRTLLAAKRGTTTVTTVAMDHGFYQLGRFSADYRRVFGELPSETLGR